MQLPEDTRAITLKYAARYRNCGAELDVGDRAHWAPSTKGVICTDCAGDRNSRVPPASDRAESGSRSDAINANQNKAKSSEPNAGGSQDPWQKLCRYARRCIEAEAAQSLVPYTRSDSLWFSHPREEQLVVGDSDSIPAPGKLADKLSSPADTANRRTVIYGWPTVVMIDHDRMPKVAPLFIVQIEQKQDSVNGWQLHAITEPEFNVAITAGGIFDPSIAEEIGDLLSNGLPFGDAEAFAELARETADLLGLDILSPLDPRTLDPHVRRRKGVYNAAVSVLAERSAFNAALLDELRQLQTRTDWANTAAAHLFPGGLAPALSD